MTRRNFAEASEVSKKELPYLTHTSPYKTYLHYHIASVARFTRLLDPFPDAFLQRSHPSADLSYARKALKLRSKAKKGS